MNDEPQIEEMDENKNQPATLGDLETWGGRLSEQIQEFRTGMKRLEKNMATKKESSPDRRN